ncbi:MAG TPA: acetylxylan esterase [Chloroflexota bacterium]|nr:acetylxylan esterase [Chloroflexota bacterium]
MNATFPIPTSKPADFDDYWQAVLDELAEIPAAPILDPHPLRSTNFSTSYSLYLTSLGPYRLYAYYNVPRGEGPFPAILHTPAYASVVTQTPFEERRQYVSMAICARGQRLSDKPFAARFPGLAIVGIDEPQSYVYRGIVADTVRAIDFLLSRHEVNARQIILTGGDTALFGAALRPQVAAVLATDPAFFVAEDQLSSNHDHYAYPIDEWQEYRRTFPAKETAMQQTLSYFNPYYFAPRIRADVRLSHGPGNSPFNRAAAETLAQAITGSVDLDERTGFGYLDYKRMLAWRDSRVKGEKS